MSDQPRPSPFKEKACALCGVVFRTTEPMRKSCSPVCRRKADEARRSGKKHGGPVKIDISPPKES
jgi:hypothetical protein